MFFRSQFLRRLTHHFGELSRIFKALNLLLDLEPDDWDSLLARATEVAAERVQQQSDNAEKGDSTGQASTARPDSQLMLTVHDLLQQDGIVKRLTGGRPLAPSHHEGDPKPAMLAEHFLCPRQLIRRAGTVVQILESTVHYVNGRMHDIRLKTLVGSGV